MHIVLACEVQPMYRVLQLHREKWVQSLYNNYAVYLLPPVFWEVSHWNLSTPHFIYQNLMQQRGRRSVLAKRQASVEQRQYTLFSSTPYTNVTTTGENSLAN